MQRAMVITVSMQAAFGVRRVEVSVPLVPALLDGSGKYRDATAVAEAARKQHQEFAQMRHAMRLEQKRASYRRRHPEGRAFKSLVRLAVTCDSAEPLGEAIRKRYERHHPPSRRDQREIEERLDRLLQD
jgi:hypothetical protein